MQQLDLFTDRFQSHKPEHGVAVRSSNGAPRWPLKYQLQVAKLTMPAWPLVKQAKSGLPVDQFREQYVASLNATGFDKIADQLRSIATATGDSRLVLLCFDNIHERGGWCHRTMFGEWWQHATGEPVVELQPNPNPAPSSDDPLFR